jgi:hypothetical protein
MGGRKEMEMKALQGGERMARGRREKEERGWREEGERVAKGWREGGESHWF